MSYWTVDPLIDTTYSYYWEIYGGQFDNDETTKTTQDTIVQVTWGYTTEDCWISCCQKKSGGNYTNCSTLTDLYWIYFGDITGFYPSSLDYPLGVQTFSLTAIITDSHFMEDGWEWTLP